mgnify:CR=1 FL=1
MIFIITNLLIVDTDVFCNVFTHLLSPVNTHHHKCSGEYTLDYEWYLSTQILPPISRLCEPIEGTSPAILSERLGLDASKYAR